MNGGSLLLKRVRMGVPQQPPPPPPGGGGGPSGGPAGGTGGTGGTIGGTGGTRGTGGEGGLPPSPSPEVDPSVSPPVLLPPLSASELPPLSAPDDPPLSAPDDPLLSPPSLPPLSLPDDPPLSPPLSACAIKTLNGFNRKLYDNDGSAKRGENFKMDTVAKNITNAIMRCLIRSCLLYFDEIVITFCFVIARSETTKQSLFMDCHAPSGLTMTA